MNREQRMVLLHIHASDLLLDGDDGWSRLMTSMQGGSGPRGKHQDVHTVSSYDCRDQKISAEFHDGTKVVVKKKDITAYVKTVPADILAEVQAARLALREEANRTYDWCHCPVQRGEPGKCFGNFGAHGERYHPTDEEDQEHLEIYWQLRDRQKAALQTALGLNPEPIPGEQMELFA